MRLTKMFDFGIIRKTKEKVEDSIFDLTRRIELKKQEKERLLRKPSSKDDVISMLHEFIDSQADEYKLRLGHMLKRYIENPENIRTATGGYKNSPLRLLSFTGKDPGGSHDPLHDAQPNLFYIFREQIKESIKQSVIDMPWPDSGLSIAEREDGAAKLDTEINKLQKELKDVLKSARDSGLDV